MIIAERFASYIDMKSLPPACDSPKFPVRGDLNIAMVFVAIGYIPFSGPIDSIIGDSGDKGSMFSM